jgi:hypothetical protein
VAQQTHKNEAELCVRAIGARASRLGEFGRRVEMTGGRAERERESTVVAVLRL